MAQKCCLMKGKDCIRFVLFVIFLFRFWGFCTVLLLITKNIGNAPLILNFWMFLYSFWTREFYCFAYTNFFLLINCSCKFLLISITRSEQLDHPLNVFILLCQSLVVTMNSEITFISNNVKGIQNWVKIIKLFEYFKSYVTGNRFIFL